MLLLFALLVQEPQIHLICGGGGVGRRTSPGTAQVWNGGGPTTVTTQNQVSEGYGDQVAVELNGDAGRIRVPRSILPTIRSGGRDGWWELGSIQYSANEITARFTLNFMNRPRVRIDRLTGHINIDGRNGNFDGQCEAYDPSQVQRRF